MITVLLAAGLANPLQACAVAMQGLGTIPHTEIEAACPEPPPRNIWTDKGDFRCDSALEFARDAAGMAHGLPPVMLNGMIVEFNRRLEECQKPMQPKPMQRNAPRLWD